MPLTNEHDERLRAEILNNCGWEFPFLFELESRGVVYEGTSLAA